MPRCRRWTTSRFEPAPLPARHRHHLRSGPDPQGKVAQRVRQIGPRGLCTSIVVAAELRYGWAKHGSERLRHQGEFVLDAIEILPLDAPADRQYGEIRTTLERSGRPIGPNDLMIAAHARALGAIVVTGNVAEFTRVDGLVVENWLD